MKRPTFLICRKQRLAMFNFFVLSILIFTSVLSAQDYIFKIIQGREGAGSLRLTNKCPHPHLFRIENNVKYLRFSEPVNAVLVGGNSSKSLGMRVYTAGLEPKLYSDQLVIQCIDCKDTCRQRNMVKLIQMTVIKPAETPPITPTPTEPVGTPTPIITPNPTVEKMSDADETPTPTTPTPAEMPTVTPTETPSETSPLTLSPAETPDATPTPVPDATNLPNSTSPSNFVGNNNLIYAVGFFTVAAVIMLVFVLISSVVGKKLFDKWKYGANTANLSSLKKAISVKEELAGKWLKKRKSQNIHAIGVGKIGGTENYCIQLFVENANGEMPDNPPIHLLPAKFRKFPIKIYEMPRAEFLSENYGSRAKEPHDTIVGGISGANTNLANEYGTIGYFCAPTILRPIRKFRKEVYLLSNSHVFANLSNPEKCAGDLIQQPSPGENKRHDFVASLENYVPIRFDNDAENPNYADAAIAKLFPNKQHKLEIPVIGKINDFVARDKVELRQNCRKFGRTTYYTEGYIFSIHLSIWIRYAATGQESFFKEQFLIVPTEAHNDFVKGGDSGSLVADYENKALGLIFAGANSTTKFAIENLDPESVLASLTSEKIKSFGVANPICQVMKSLNVKLML